MKSSKLEPGDLVLVQIKGFQEKHKITDQWEKDSYEVVKQRQNGLPVFVVANNGHKLFLLHYQHEIESNVDNVGKFDGKRTPEENQDDVHMSDLEDQPVYKGPQTQSHTKALMKANLLINECFQADGMLLPVIPIARREPISLLVGHFLYLQAVCVYNLFYDLVSAGKHLSS